MATVLAALDELKTGQMRLEETQIALRVEVHGDMIATRTAILARLDRLQEAPTREQEDAVTFGTAEQARRSVAPTAEQTEIQAEQIAALHQMVRRLQKQVDELRRPPPDVP